jgi:hypothetical protein
VTQHQDCGKRATQNGILHQQAISNDSKAGEEQSRNKKSQFRDTGQMQQNWHNLLLVQSYPLLYLPVEIAVFFEFAIFFCHFEGLFPTFLGIASLLKRATNPFAKCQLPILHP